MKKINLYLIIFGFILTLSFARSAEVEKECETSETIILDKQNLATVQTILSSIELNLKQKQKAFEQLNSNNSQEFIKSLPPDDQEKTNELLIKINESSTSLVQIVEAEGDPILLVDGIDPSEFPHEWIKPFNKLMQKKYLSYFFKWDKFKSIDYNRDHLLEAIESILEKHKEKNLTIIGYSAGGVLTILAIDKLADSPLLKRIQFNTIASPLFGYKAPGIAWLGAPFVGKTTIQIGIGNYDQLVHKHMSQCNHYVNTNCEMDQHTCVRDGLNPQIGPIDAPFSLPCGEGHINRIDNESHSSILNHAFNEIIK